ncbi:uncharacterized protein [Atheta coriaria]|uniref:uncharacterized protein n=1 Tax=Dalotia coriaria TaxID=877792 RepID=UPI0031F35FB7
MGPKAFTICWIQIRNFQYYLMDIGNSPWHYVVELLQLLELIFGEVQFILVGLLLMIGVIGFTGATIVCRLENSCEQLQYATFHCIPWDGDLVTARNLQLMNLYTKKNFTIVLAGFTHFSNENLVQVGKAAYSCLTFYKHTLK